MSVIPLPAPLALTFTAVLLWSAPAQAANCAGRITNPLTDICWSCMSPISIAGQASIKTGSLPDYSTDATKVCSCGSGLNTAVGINISFWEPVRTAEVVRHAWCFPSLGGVVMQAGIRASDHARTPKNTDTHRRTAFWQVHWYQSPWIFVMEALLDNTCLEQAPWDLAYLSELDPLWDDTMTSFLLAPDAALFTAGAAFGACAVDCVAATTGLSSKTLYWCSGCQGGVFPLSGWMAAQVSPLQAWHLMAHRFAIKLSREGLLWSAHGNLGQCGPYLQPLMDKPAWRTQLLYPARSTSKASGSCCHPLGRSTAPWAAGKSFPITGEDGAILLWRKRDCCLTSGVSNAASSLSRAAADPSLSSAILRLRARANVSSASFVPDRSVASPSILSGVAP